MKYSILLTLLRWLAVVLILRVLVEILSNYSDYFPPNFDALFLLGREATFHGAYSLAFYVHIFSAPMVLMSGLVLLSEGLRRHYRAVHRWLGRAHVAVLLLLVLPSGVVMSGQAFGGWPAGLSFVLLSTATAVCAIMGVRQARNRRYQEHRRWMIRSYLLICSAVMLRLISGTVGLFEVPSPEDAYVLAAWTSWVVPLASFEILQRFWPFTIKNITCQDVEPHHTKALKVGEMAVQTFKKK